MKYSGSVVRSSSWPQRRRRCRISDMQDCSSRLPISRCVTLALSPNLEMAPASLPTALPSNPRRLPVEFALLLPGIRDGCAMLFAFVVIRDIALRRSWTCHEFLPPSGKTGGKQNRALATGMILRHAQDQNGRGKRIGTWNNRKRYCDCTFLGRVPEKVQRRRRLSSSLRREEAWRSLASRGGGSKER